MGPLWGLGLTLDRDLLGLILLANLLFSFLVSLTVFRGRPVVDRVFVVLGLFLVVSLVGLTALYYFAGTPVRDVQFFVVD